MRLLIAAELDCQHATASPERAAESAEDVAPRGWAADPNAGVAG